MLTRQPASHNWAAAFAAVPETEVVAVFDLGAETREAFVACWAEPGRPIQPYDDYEQMLREIQPDLLSVATRQTMHARQIEQAVAAGAQPHPVHVPPTPEPWEAGPALVADLVAAVRSGGVTACDVAGARRASVIGFAIHASNAAGGRRLTLDEVDPNLRIPSFPWGNE